MDDDLKPRSIKIGEERWQRWQSEAKARGVSLTALIIERMDAPDGVISSHKAMEAFTGRKAPRKSSKDKPGPLREDVPGYRLTRTKPVAEKPVASLNLPVLTDFPARQVQQRGAGKGKKA